MSDRYLPLACDINPLTYGGTYYRGTLADGFETFEIQPVLEYVSVSEAREIGHPFWSREGYHDRADLIAALTDRPLLAHLGLERLQGADIDTLEESDLLALVHARHSYGAGTAEGPAGWSEDLPLEALGISAQDGAAADDEFRGETGESEYYDDVEDDDDDGEE